MFEIIGRSNDGWDYEFMVVELLDGNNYKWLADFEDAKSAYDYAHIVGGRVVHNVQVTHKERA